MSEPVLLIEKTGAIVTITLNRAAVCNALDAELMTLLNQTLQEISHDESVHVVIVQGQGKHFCAGADLTLVQEMAQGSSQENMTVLVSFL